MQELSVIQSQKAILRAITSTFVNHKKEVLLLLNKYGVNVDKDSKKGVVLNELIQLLAKNEDFASDFTKLMIAKKELVSSNSTRSAAGIITGIVSVVGGVASKIAGAKQAKTESENLQIQQQILAEQQMMQLINQAEQDKARKQRATILIASISLIAVFAILGIVLYNKSKKK